MLLEQQEEEEAILAIFTNVGEEEEHRVGLYRQRL